MLNSRSVNCRLDSLTITIAKVWGRFHLMQSKKSRISPTGTVELVFCRHFGEMPKMQSVHLDQTHFGYKGQLNRCQAKPLSRHDISIGERLSSHFWRRDLCVSEQNIGHLMVCESEIGFVWQSSLGCLCSCLCGKRIWITHFTQWMKSFVFFVFLQITEMLGASRIVTSRISVQKTIFRRQSCVTSALIESVVNYAYAWVSSGKNIVLCVMHYKWTWTTVGCTNTWRP